MDRVLRLELSGGGHAELLSTDGDVVTLLSTRAMPPGSTLQGRDSSGETFQVKVRSSVRQHEPDGERSFEFKIEGRFVNLSRAQRLRLVGG